MKESREAKKKGFFFVFVIRCWWRLARFSAICYWKEDRMIIYLLCFCKPYTIISWGGGSPPPHKYKTKTDGCYSLYAERLLRRLLANARWTLKQGMNEHCKDMVYQILSQLQCCQLLRVLKLAPLKSTEGNLTLVCFICFFSTIQNASSLKWVHS